ncbi:MAG TPA: GTPase, partial [Pseudacidobacterium sp.]|nr:GTPase [Pseudacidobacterium sp.]
IGGIPIELIDTAGLREAADEAESIGIQKSREALADADLVLIVLDASVPLREDEAELIASLEGRRALVAANKCDLNLEQSELQIPGDGLKLVRTSAITGEGIDELRRVVLELVHGPGAGNENGMLTTVRHHQAVTGALDSLAAARKAVAEKIPHEMLLLDLYAALRHLDSLTGETTPDDILNLIFSTFCIGK